MPLIDFKIELGTLLISGFSQRKRKRRSVEPVYAEVPVDQHVSDHVQGRKRKCVHCIKAGNELQKATKLRHASSAVFARLPFAGLCVTMNFMLLPCEQ